MVISHLNYFTKTTLMCDKFREYHESDPGDDVPGARKVTPKPLKVTELFLFKIFVKYYKLPRF